VHQGRSIFAPLRYAAYRSLWATILVAYCGSFVQSVAAGWIMTTLTTSNILVALVQVTTTLPIMLFSLPAGVLADQYERRITILVAQCMMVFASGLLLTCGLLGILSPVVLLIATFIIGCAWALHSPSWDATMRDLVPSQVLPDAVTLNSVAYNSMRSVGPAVGGFILAAAGSASAFAVSAVSYLPFIIGLLVWTPERHSENAPRQPFLRSLLGGLQFAWMSPIVTRVTIRTLLYGCSASALIALLPLLVSRNMAGGAMNFGTLLASFGIGAILGGLGSPFLRQRLNTEALLRLTTIFFASCGLGLSINADVLIAHMLLLPAGACWVISMSLMSAMVQLSVPRWVAGRTMALYHTATYGGMALGALVWGALADEIGVAHSLTAGSLSMLVVFLVGLFYPLVQADAEPDPGA
jgi:MFS family permease